MAFVRQPALRYCQVPQRPAGVGGPALKRAEDNLSDLEKILLTTLATVLGGVAVFTVGQVLTRFLIEPIHEQRKLVGTIADSLLYYAHYLADSFDRPIAEVGEAPDKFRRLAAELMAKTVAIPGYRVWGWLRVIRPFNQVIAARGALFGLSNTLHRADWQRKIELARQIAATLNVTEVDSGLLARPASDDADG
jgi:hypothetical protein